MNDDEKFEQFVAEAAADYNAPRGEVPRDAMWQAIRARRGMATAPMAPTPVRREPPRLALWMGLAATLLIGVALGQFMGTRGATSTVAVQPASLVAVPSPASAAVPQTDESPTVRVAVAPARPAPTPRPDGYGVASARHLQAVQLLLTSYAANNAETRTDTLLGLWAKDLLRNTRLLLDSPAARDPQRARLLQDLEVILVQLVQRSPDGLVDDRAAVERSIQKSHIIPRLRSAVPASLPSGTE